MYQYSYKTIIGIINIIENNNKIISIDFNSTKKGIETVETELIKETKKQLDEYFNKTRNEFNIPFEIEGTEFQKKVYIELLKIPYSKTISYKELARRVGNEKACRAVGNANNKNRIPIIIPCHRVIGTNNRLVGYGGGLPIKKQLLDIEKGSDLCL